MPPSGHPQDTAAVAAKPLSRKRRILIWTLVVLASIIAAVGIMTTWVKRQMLDNAAWNRATTQMVQDPKVQGALATYMVNQLYDNIDVGQALSERLPPNLKQLGPPLAGALEQPAQQTVARLLTRPRVQQLFINASTVAHQKLINVLENKTGFGISTGSGEVTLNVHEMVVEVGTELGIPSDALAKLPNKAGTITLMKSDQLSAAQAGVQGIRTLSAWILVVVLALTLGTMADINGAGVAPTMRIAATGHQWWWEFSYGGMKTANELHIPVDTPIALDLTSVDVIHSFWVPELGPKMDMLPGVTNRLRLFARRA